ncbi:hypothetical protein [Streptomyces sp. NPDC056464]|uniref:hypothetical protein n=1 Tax=Streptomyces sp. NPDC056464 TaxID=3345828 RepID=UPI00367E9A87
MAWRSRDPDMPAPDHLEIQHPTVTTTELRTPILDDGQFGAGARQMAGAHASAAFGRTYYCEFGWRSTEPPA